MHHPWNIARGAPVVCLKSLVFTSQGRYKEAMFIPVSCWPCYFLKKTTNISQVHLIYYLKPSPLAYRSRRL